MNLLWLNERYAACYLVRTWGRECCLSVPSLWYSLVLFFLDENFSSPLRENSMVVVFPFPSTSSWVGQVVVHSPSRIVTHPKDKKLPSEKAFGRRRILIPGFIQSPPMLAVYGVALSLSLCRRCRWRFFPSRRMSPKGICHTSVVLLERKSIIMLFILIFTLSL